MKFPLSLIAAALLSAFLTAHAEEDWIPLFDGKTTEGWTPRAEVEKFEAKDGELHLLSKKNVWVVSDKEMSDFEFTADVLLPDDADEVALNSGIAFRLTGESGKPKGYQCEIEALYPGENGGVFAIGLGGWLYPKENQKKEHRAAVEGILKKGEWNTYRVICEGPSITTFVNGKQIAQIEDTQSTGGYFGIQHHGKGGTIRFRNIKARELPSPTPAASVKDRPNVLWIVAEDMSPTLGCYGDEYATTPNLDQFAKESVRYTNVFAAAPVCSPSRSTLITGMWAPSTGTSQMRSAFPLPDEVHGFPSYLRDAGYFTTNNVKTDYNNGDAQRLIEESWDENSDTAHWRSEARKSDQPFFSVFNHMVSHQSRTMVWPYDAFVEHVQSKLSAEEIHDPASAPVPPYYPDTETVRRTVARFYDCVTVMDQEVGRLLQQLEDDGLADDTIVFFYSDHGSGMPRHKRLLHDSGMKVPLMVRFPEKYEDLAPAAPGETIDRLVTFVDFPSTVLTLLGLSIPDHMQGDIFLGPQSGSEKKYVYGFRDRVDEVFDCSRSIRSKEYLYIRNYLPHLSWMQPSVFSDLGEIRGDISAYARENPDKLTNAQRGFVGSPRAAEEFYNVQADPDQIDNLLDGDLSADQQRALDAHRAAFEKQRMAILDVGVLPETVMADYIEEEDAPIRDITTGKTNHQPDLEAAWAAADLVGTGTREEFLDLLRSGDDTRRFWAVIGLRNAFADDESLHDQLFDYTDDISEPVRIEMAFWLAEYSEKHREEALAVLVRELENPAWWTALRACRAIELLGEKASSVLPVMEGLYSRTRHAEGDENFFLAFSAGAFLEKMGVDTDKWDFSPNAGSFSADPPPEEEKEN